MHFTKMHGLGNDYLYYYGELEHPEGFFTIFWLYVIFMVSIISLWQGIAVFIRNRQN